MGEVDQVTGAELSGKQLKRLKDLTKDWEKDPTGLSFGSPLNLVDLRFLLQHFAPLQHLIRDMVDRRDSYSHFSESESMVVPVDFVPSTAMAEQWQQEHDLRQRAEQALQQACAQHEQVKAAWQQREAQRDSQLQQEQAQRGHAEAELRTVTTRLHQLQQEWQQGKAELATLRAAGQSPVVRLLAHDAELAQGLGLHPIGGDASAELVRCVAVLSQLDTLKRLWDLLKDRCEQQRRPASDEELALLTAALTWHNHNWSQKPFRLYQPSTGSGFEFEKAQRAMSASPTGEALRELWLPGIADHGGRLLKKALVVTG